MCFGGGSDNSQMIALQQQEAEAARKKEDERQARIDAALQQVKDTFEGKVTDKTKKVSATIAAPGTNVKIGDQAGTVTGYKWIKVDPKTGKVGTVTTAPLSASATTNVPGSPGYHNTGVYGHDAGSMSPAAGSGTYTGSGNARGTGGGSRPQAVAQTQTIDPNTQWAVQGPDGKIYAVGSTVTGDQVIGHNQVNPFAKFLDDYRKGMRGYYSPQIATQYGDARDELAYRLARAGLTNSSMANTEMADLRKQDRLNLASLRDKTEKAVGDIKTNITNTENAAKNAVMASEKPDVAANAATAQVSNIMAQEPDLSPLASVFNLAEIGTAGAIQQFNNQRYRSQVPGYNPSGATRII